MANDFIELCVSIGKTVWNLFRLDGTTRGGSVELWVVLTTVLLLANFAVASYGSQVFPRWFMKAIGEFFVVLNASSVPYTIGLMEPSIKQGGGGGTLSNFFQVWAVLIVTMQYSINVGRPSKGKDLTLVDLLSSLLSANLLRRSSTDLKIRIPLWLIWSLNALRVVRYYLDSMSADQAIVHDMKLVSDYMASERHTAANACPDTMVGYRYLVHGEEEHEIEILRSKDDTKLEKPKDATTLEKPKDATTLEMDWVPPAGLITLETVWKRRYSEDNKLLAKDSDDKYKDVCLSFALYKLLRRRFYDFPMPEANNSLTRKLVFKGILKDTNNYERAFRVTEVELSFLRDFSFSKHAVVFAGGFPIVRLLLSLLMVASLLYTLYAIRDIPSAGTYATADDQLARVTHGVGVTRCIIAIIVCRELWEIRIYMWSQGTKILIIYNYVRLLRPVELEPSVQQKQGWITKLQLLTMEKAARFMFRHVRRGRWKEKIHQYSLISKSVGWWDTKKKMKLQDEAKEAVFESLKALKAPDASLGSYLKNAFQDNNHVLVHIEDLLNELEGETHKILVWHVATGLGQIGLLEAHTTGHPEFDGEPRRPKGYVTAVSLSNYCAYLVSKALVPDNGLVAKKVFAAVEEEALKAWSCVHRREEAYQKLVKKASVPDPSGAKSILNIGAQLSQELQSAYGDPQALWAHLGNFWAGYLLHLSANTRAAKHQVHLQGGGGELTTHLWALLSHAGFVGDTAHGHQMLDPEDLADA